MIHPPIDSKIEWLTKNYVPERSPEPERLINTYNDIADERSAMEYAKKVNSAREAVGLSSGGSFFFAATIPNNLLAAMEAVDPDFLGRVSGNKSKFYRWLARHRHKFRTGHITFIG